MIVIECGDDEIHMIIFDAAYAERQVRVCGPG